MDEAERTQVRREVGLRLRHHRHRAGMTQTEVAAAVSVSVSAVSMWEQGHRELRYGTLVQLASLYDVAVGSFFDAETA
jgi:transcriptional regulator with XRE-family HTH domain